MKIRGAYGGADLLGRLGNTIFYDGKGGPQARTGTSPVNPNTPGQVAVRQSMSSNSNRWNLVLTTLQRQAWDEYALGTPLPNGFGMLHTITGRAMYMRTNVARNQVGLATSDAAPITPGVAPAPELVVSADTIDGVEVGVTSPVIAVNELINFRLSIPVNPAVNFFKAPFTLSAIALNATGFPLNLKPAAQVFVGQKYFVAARYYNADSKVSFEVIQPIEVLA